MDVPTSRVTNEEEAIFRAHQLDLTYAQSGVLYHLLLGAPRSTYDPRQKPGPHADGIVGSTNVKSLNQSVGGPASSVSSIPTQSMDVHSVQSSTNPNGSQPPEQNKKKRRNNRKGGKMVINPRTIMRR